MKIYVYLQNEILDEYIHIAINQWLFCCCLFSVISLRGTVLERANLISSPGLSRFLAFVFMCKRAENPESHRLVITNGRLEPHTVLFLSIEEVPSDTKR